MKMHTGINDHRGEQGYRNQNAATGKKIPLRPSTTEAGEPSPRWTAKHVVASTRPSRALPPPPELVDVYTPPARSDEILMRELWDAGNCFDRIARIVGLPREEVVAFLLPPDADVLIAHTHRASMLPPEE